MSATPVVAIFDIGKTNKKLFLFDEGYKIVYEEATTLDEIMDDDDDPCEDLSTLQTFIFSSLQNVLQKKEYKIKAVNFSTYGASFINLDEKGKPVTPLYNYLKKYPQDLKEQFYATYGDEEFFSIATASPVLGHLNSGLQLYWLKHAKPQIFEKISCSLHLPQYSSFLLTNKKVSELTSIGCHTALWDFSRHAYHEWVHKEDVISKLAPVVPSTEIYSALKPNKDLLVGVGLHDSSAALIPYLASFRKPFVLLSTGTWCISLNPFNTTPLTAEELAQDCLCYLTYEGTPVKASRLFAGNSHEQEIKRMAAHFGKAVDYYKAVKPDMNLLNAMAEEIKSGNVKDVGFAKKDLACFSSYEDVYHRLMQYLVAQQVVSTQLVLKGTTVRQIFVDGGFGKNSIYMHLLAAVLPEMEVFGASLSQATAMGAAMAIHPAWNRNHLPPDIVELKYYGTAQSA